MVDHHFVTIRMQLATFIYIFNFYQILFFDFLWTLRLHLIIISLIITSDLILA